MLKREKVMKYLKYIVIGMAAATSASCTDDAPVAVANLEKCAVQVTDVTPVSFEVKINNYGNLGLDRLELSVWPADGPEPYGFGFYDSFNNGTAVVNLSESSYYGFEHVPGMTYNYSVSSTVTNGGLFSVKCEIARGTVTTPTLDEYFGEGSVILEESIVSSDMALLTVAMPDGLWALGDATLVYSASADFANPREASLADGGAYSKYSKCSFRLDNLQENTRYYVKLRGTLEIGEVSGYDRKLLSDYELTPTPESFTTTSGDEVVTDAKCQVAENLVIDNMAVFTIWLPDTWTFYKEYTNDKVNCTVVYATDPDFGDAEIVGSAELKDNYYSCTLENLTPSTTYYLGLVGDFECKSMNVVLKDHLLGADKTITTPSENQIETVDGHQCVDLGLSVKWATEDIPGSFQWVNRDQLQDIAGSVDDYATRFWGEMWQTPSQEQWKDLIADCDVWEFGTYAIFKGKNGNYLRLPRVNWVEGDYNHSAGETSEYVYMTSTASPDYRGCGMILFAYYDYLRPYDKENTHFTMFTISKPGMYVHVRPVTTK